MNPLWGHFVGIFILLMMGVFIGIWIWAWHGSHRPVFSRMAQLPMLDGMAREPAAEEWAAHERAIHERAAHAQPGRERPGRDGCGQCRPAKIPALAASSPEGRP